jgi:DNA-binding LytR/AlgR family response regulator
MTITVYILDDEAHAVHILTEYVRLTPGLKLLGSSTDPLEALEAIKAKRPLLTFLDINMPDVSGLDMTRLISGITGIVFTTSFREFGPEAFDHNVTDYLLKPISYERFFAGIEKFRNQQLLKGQHDVKEPYSFFVKGDVKGKYISIIARDITYIQSDEHYIHIYAGTSRVTTHMTIAKILHTLPEDQFLRVHRSYIINTDRIKSVQQAHIRMDNLQLIPLGRSYRDTFFRHINPILLTGPREPKS